MAVYFFHLTSPAGYEPDEIGTEFPDIEAAYLGAYQAAFDMMTEMLRQRIDVARCSFDIANMDGEVLLKLPFGELLHPRGRHTPYGRLELSLHRHQRRTKELQQELQAGYRQSRALLRETRKLLAK